MAMCQKERCVVCLKDVPKSSMRRRLNSEATKHVVPVLRELGSRTFTSSSLLPDASDTFICRLCFRNAEKLLRLRTEVSELECELTQFLKRSGEQRGLDINVAAELRTPPAQLHGPTGSDQTPTRCLPDRTSALKRRVLQTELRGSEHTPTRGQRPSPSRAPPSKRRALDTPSRQFMQQTHVADSPAVAVLVKTKNRNRVHHLTSSLKRIGRSVGRRSRKSIALQSMNDRAIRKRILSILANDVQKELAAMCMLKHESILRATEPSALRSFSWEAFGTEVKETAPNLFAILDGSLQVHVPPSHQKGRKTSKTRRVNKAAILGLCTAILCRYRNQSMNLVQRLVSIILYKGGASMQVFRRLQRLLICLSHKRTVAYLDKLGEKHDAAVHEWRQSILEANSSGSQEEVVTEPQSSGQRMQSSAEPNVSEESSSSQSATEIAAYSPVAPTFSPIVTMTSLTSTESSSESSGNITEPASRIKTYKLVGDNIDKTIKPRDMRIDHQARSLHYFHTYALRDRIDVTHLDDQPSLPCLESIDVSTVLPTEQDKKVMKGLFGIHVARVLKKHVLFFTKFGKGLERHIQHDFSKEMSQKSEVVPLGVILKNETKTEDMVSILENLHCYVPTTSTEHSVKVPGHNETFNVFADHFHHTLFGGDQLTAARVRGCQRVRSNSQRGCDRLEGLIPVIEDWHAKGCLLTTIWKRLYKCSSGRDRGTLYHLRNLINRRNVVKKPMKAVDACEEFFLLVVESHILSAAMTLFGMTSVDAAPTSQHHFPVGSDKLAHPERKQILLMAVGSLVDKHVDLSFDEKDESDSKEADRDRVVEYASELLTLGLLLMEFIDAIRAGDGGRICRCWQFFLLLFKATGRTNYSVEAFTLLAQLNFIFTPRMAAQLKWNRTVNIHGRPGKNIPCDLHMEHLNRICKGAISGLGANISDKAVLRMGKCLGEMERITHNYDHENGIPSQSGKHARKSEKDDRTKILEQLQHMKVFTSTPGRKHANFPKFRANPARKLASDDLKEWMKEQLKKLTLH